MLRNHQHLRGSCSVRSCVQSLPPTDSCLVIAGGFRSRRSRQLHCISNLPWYRGVGLQRKAVLVVLWGRAYPAIRNSHLQVWVDNGSMSVVKPGQIIRMMLNDFCRCTHSSLCNVDGVCLCIFFCNGMA
jgi:hypothetical protein